MEMTPAHWAALIAGAALTNQLLGAVRQWGETRLRQGKHIAEEKSAVLLLAQKVDALAVTQGVDSPKLRQLEIDLTILTGKVGSVADSLASLVKATDRLAEAQIETQKHVTGAWTRIVELTGRNRAGMPVDGR